MTGYVKRMLIVFGKVGVKDSAHEI